MHPRHRSPVNGYRSGPVGMGGVGAPSRISPEGSVRGGNGVYGGAGYRSYNRGFGRGQPRPFQPPPQPPQRRGEIFVEAGRLAAEYLVSKGMLPPNVFSGKWQNGSGRSQMGGFQSIRGQDGDELQDGRTSAHARLGDGASDVSNGSNRRRLSDDYMGSRDYGKGRSRSGSFKSSSSDWNRESSRSGSWSEKARVSPDKNLDGDSSSGPWSERAKVSPEKNVDGDASSAPSSEKAKVSPDSNLDGDASSVPLSEKDKVTPDRKLHGDASSGYAEEQQVVNDVGSEEQKAGECAPKFDASCSTEPALEKKQMPDIVNPKESSAASGKDIIPETDMESTGTGDGIKISGTGDSIKISDADINELKDDSNDEVPSEQHCAKVPSSELEKQCDTGDVPIDHCAEVLHSVDKIEGDLLTLSRFANVPTRMRSSLTARGSKIDPVLISEDENNNEGEQCKVSGEQVQDDPMDVSLGDSPADHDQCLKFEPNSSDAPPSEDSLQIELTYKDSKGEISRSKSFPEKSMMNELEPSEGQLGFGRCNSMVIERGEKRSLVQIGSWEGNKRPREWIPTDVQADQYMHHSNPTDKQQEGGSRDEQVVETGDRKSVENVSSFPEGVSDPCIGYSEEKQLFPASFKICDLNLMEGAGVNENHNAIPVPMFPSIPIDGKEPISVDVDLSMSKDCNSTDKHVSRGVDGKGVEIIDLEGDSVHEEKCLTTLEQKEQEMFNDFESFPESAQNANEISDAQDGYGLMISELLGADIPSCTPLPSHINPMHEEIGLHNGEEILGDDDSIYMSLGEIPISFLPGWEQQPPQEYGKPF